MRYQYNYCYDYYYCCHLFSKSLPSLLLIDYSNVFNEIKLINHDKNPISEGSSCAIQIGSTNNRRWVWHVLLISWGFSWCSQGSQHQALFLCHRRFGLLPNSSEFTWVYSWLSWPTKVKGPIDQESVRNLHFWIKKQLDRLDLHKFWAIICYHGA